MSEWTAISIAIVTILALALLYGVRTGKLRATRRPAILPSTPAVIAQPRRVGYRDQTGEHRQRSSLRSVLAPLASTVEREMPDVQELGLPQHNSKPSWSRPK